MSEDNKKESIFTPKRTVKYFLINFVAMALIAMLIWPLLDLMFQGFDTSKYTWTWINGIIEPIVFAIIIDIIEFVFWNAFHKKK